ncbi:MAG TPA: amino acid adenylation domain-containing protein [Candidatus Angelobacter sp.]|nr:amino acid adenylation domain-containing protein [Candidatus Angelobacter sp.]
MKINSSQPEYAASIAVIGKSGRFPKAGNLNQFWENLCAGKECISFFTEEELLSAGVDTEMLRRPNYVKAMGIVEDPEFFDSQFFGYTPREAQMIDPQQRVFLECAWEALEDAGYASDDPGMVGVYASSTMSTYIRNLLANPEILGSSDIMQLVSGNDKDYVPTRVSYKLNLRGPSVCVQSACSSSLVAVHLACRSLLTYECDLALAGGVSIGVPLKQGYLYEEGGITSPDGHCRAFDAKANGTIIGFGCGVVVLKRLSEAIKDSDNIQAIIRGSAINNDGSNKIGYTAPSVDGQADVIRAALAVARVPSETITYVEAHGTGTPLGDPIELTALSKAFRSSVARKARCAIGSIKTNIGHLDAAAGIAGLIKTVLTLEHKALPPSLNFETPNPKAGFDASPFYVNTRLSEWTSVGTPRRAGLSSLGLGGTNVHVVLEEAPDLDRQTSDRKQHLLVFSAKSQAALESLTARIADHLQAHPGLRLSDVAHTLQVGRKASSYRRAVVCETDVEAIERLRQPHADGVATGIVDVRNRPVVFMFPGGGTQYPGMGRELYQQERVFRETFDKCIELLTPILNQDLRNLVHADPTQTESAAAALARPSLGLPAIFATEYAMAQLFKSWGIEPKSMIGHSLGEYAAACVAGVFSLSDALALVALRGKLFETLPPGAMLSVQMREADVAVLHLADVDIAAINGPDNCVISGRIGAIDQATAILESEGVEFRRLHIDTAAHCSMVDAITDPLRSFLGRLKLNAPKIPFISNLTGTWITTEEAVDPGYWVRHLRHAVRFADGISELLKQPEIALVELGPGHTLSTLARPQVREKSVPVISSMKHPHETAPETRVLYTSLGKLWTVGAQVNWNSQYSKGEARRISLPTYPFERQRYFVEPPKSGEAQLAPHRKKPDITNWFYAPSWKQMAAWKPRRVEQESPSTWMVFSGGGRLESEFVAELRRANHEVGVVLAGPESSTFEKVDAQVFRIDPANAGHYSKLFTSFAGSGPANFVHFWSLTPDPDPQQAFYSLLFLAQTVGEANTAEPKNIWVVSSGVAQVSEDDLSSPDKAMLLGPCRTIPLEYSNLHCALIDVGSLEPRIATTLLQCCANPPQSSLMAYRMGRFWSQCVEPLPLSSSGEGVCLRQHGVYLITGGLGGIGLTLALHLARKTGAKIILVDVAAARSREDWDRLLEIESTPAAVRFQINALRGLEELHTPLLVAQADVCNERQIREVVAEATQKFGAIHGVIHAAGMPGGGIMQFKTPAEIEAVLAPKVSGTRVLDRIFKDIDLDFFVACSSVTSVQGEFAQADNCSANVFLDAFCLNNSFKPPTRTMAIGWDTWKDAGMAQNAVLSPDLEHLRNQRFAVALSSVEAVEVFDRILNFDVPRSHVLVSTADLDLSPRRSNATVPALENTVSTETLELYSRPEANSTFVAPRNEVERQIAEVWQAVLGLKAIGAYDNFWELGGHSLLATQVVSRLKEKFHIPLPLRALFEMPTIDKLAERVRLQLESASSAIPSEPSAESEAQKEPIRRVDRNGKLALSPSQERLWFINQLEPENTAYNVPQAVRIQGPLEVEALERTLREIVRRHESLRTRFVSMNSEPQQVIDSGLSVELPVTELSHLPEAERVAEAQRLAREDTRQPYDLARGPMFRMKLLRLASQDHVLVFNMHHIIADSWSTVVLLREVSAIYNSFSNGQPSPLPELDIQYADFSAWQRELLSGPLLEKQLEYWKRKLAGVEPQMLPTDRPRAGIQRTDGAVARFTVPIELTEALRTLSRKQGATLYMMLLAAFQSLLGRYSGQSDIAVGSPIAGRLRTETEELIGIFINTLVMRTDLSGQPNSMELLRRVKETTLEAYAHQEIPFEKLVEVLLPQRDLARSPLFQVLFILQNVPWTAFELGAAKMLPLELDNGAAQFEITLILVETSSGMEGCISYYTDLYDAATISRMIEHYQMLLSGVVENPNQPMAWLPLLTANERQRVVEEWNRTEAQYPLDKCVHELFEEQVARTPRAVAVVDEYRQFSYQELNRHANQIAHHLRTLGVGPDVVVGLCMERSVEMVVGMLGVLKAGGAYVPFDPEHPTERLAYMMQDVQLNFLLTQERLRDIFAGFTGHVICVDTHHLGKVLEENDANPDVSGVAPENLAYVIYTSGSTGRPKGVGMTQGPLHTLVRWQLMSTPGPQRTLQFTPLTFDVSFQEIFATLCSGGSLVLISNDARRDPSELWKVLCDREVERLFLPFIALQELAEAACAAEWESTSLREVMTAGEQLKVTPALQRFFDRLPVAILENQYGPTETHIVTAYRLRATPKEWPQLPPIGKSIANNQAYVLDENYTPLPIGVPGGLYLAGAGLARGYWNRPDLTAERFLPNPLSVRGGERMYLTGDRARWLPDGNLEFLGRVDHQVKIRGFRIELGEIEAALQEHGGVRQAVVIAREDETGDKRLVAYVVPEQADESGNGSGRAELQISELREHLLGKLPEYMMPSAYVQLEELPLNQSGKVDRKNLPQPDTDTPEQEYVGPRSATEETLCRLWQEILRRERVGIYDDFFKIGGHSLLAARVAARMRESFQIAIPLRRMFESPTVARLAEVIDEITQRNGANGTNGAPSPIRPAIKRVARKAALVDVD